MPDPDSKRQTGGEVTPEMIEAGKRAYREWYARGGEDDYGIGDLVRSILSQFVPKDPSKDPSVVEKIKKRGR